MQEKRRHQRISKKIKSEVRSNDAMTFSSSLDISNGGIFISTPEPVTVNAEVSLSILLPDGNSIDIKGTVKWISEDSLKDNKCGMGIEFNNINEDQTGKLKDLLEK